jgi:hypothetical protein
MPPEEPVSARDALSAAWDEAEKGTEDEGLEAPGGDEGEEAGGSGQGTEESVRPEGEEEAGGEEKKEEPDEGGEKKSGSPEDKKVAKSEDRKESDGADRKEEKPLESNESLEKAPVSWKPGVREHWKGLPPAVKAEIHRRETEIQTGLQQAAGHKKLATEYYQTVAPFQSLIQAQNSTPAQAIHNLMSTAARLTMGSSAEKAKVVGEIIKNYGVDIRVLDEHLSGQAPSKEDETTSAIHQVLQKELKPFQEFMGRFSQQESQITEQANARIAQDISAFQADSKNEFFEDVREDMADLMELAYNRGREMTIEQAYERACAADPEISKIIRQRQEAAATRENKEAAEKKRKAASSLESGGGSGERGPKQRDPSDMRGSIQDAWDALETGQRV